LQKDEAMNKLTYPRLLGVDGAKKEAECCVQQAVEALNCFRSDIEPYKLLIELVQGLPKRIL
jgi:hypothetical protein